MDKVLETIQEMRISRGWDKSDTLPILIKSVSVEAAELLETIQWDEENIDMEAVKGELADVLMFLSAATSVITVTLPSRDTVRRSLRNIWNGWKGRSPAFSRTALRQHT